MLKHLLNSVGVSVAYYGFCIWREFGKRPLTRACERVWFDNGLRGVNTMIIWVCQSQGMCKPQVFQDLKVCVNPNSFRS